jgi:serine/threonine-protein kinase RsbW
MSHGMTNQPQLSIIENRHKPPRAEATRQQCDFRARLNQFQAVKAFVESFGATMSLHPEDWLKLVLLAEELFTNTIQHGYRRECDEVVIVALETEEKFVRLVYEDSAPPYDPLAAAARVDLQSSVEQRPVGGLGMLLTVRLAERAAYVYEDGRNKVELLLARTI